MIGVMTEPSSYQRWLTILRASAALVVVLILSPLALGRTDLLDFQGSSPLGTLWVALFVPAIAVHLACVFVWRDLPGLALAVLTSVIFFVIRATSENRPAEGGP